MAKFHLRRQGAAPGWVWPLLALVLLLTRLEPILPCRQGGARP